MAYLKEDGSLDVERIQELPIDEFTEVIGSLTDDQFHCYFEEIRYDKEDRRLCIERIKTCENIKFTEKIEDLYTIGYIDDHNGQIKVSYLADNVGRYVSLEYDAVKKNNSDYVSRVLERRSVHGRHYVLEDKIVLVSTFPILDEDMNYFHKQLHHALLEIWDMNSIAEHAPE